MRLVDADALKEKAIHYSETEYHFDHDAVEIDDIDDAPNVDAVPVVHGEWIYHNYENGNWYCTCSNCGKGDLHAIKGTVPYCWNCGAKMDGGSHDKKRT